MPIEVYFMGLAAWAVKFICWSAERGGDFGAVAHSFIASYGFSLGISILIGVAVKVFAKMEETGFYLSSLLSIGFVGWLVFNL